jgi:hypothetical protein
MEVPFGNYGFVYHLGRVDIFPVAGIEPSALVGDNLKNANRIGRPRRTRRRPWGAFLLDQAVSPGYAGGSPKALAPAVDGPIHGLAVFIRSISFLS